MTGYVRQSAADIVPTGVVRAAPINNELNALRDAFAANGGHKHDGTTAEGHPVPVMGDSDLMNKIATDTSNNRHGVFVEVGGVAVEQVRFQDGAIVPVTDNDVDLGTSSNEFKNLYITGVANVDSLVADTADINGGTVDAAVIGATTPAAGTFTNLTANTSLVATTADINAGTIDGAVIGGAVAQAITGTTVTATTGFVGGLTGNVTGNTTGTHTGGVIGNVTGDVTGNVTASTGTSSFNDVTINGTLNMNAGTSATITNLTSPTNSGDAATKGYVDTADALKLNLSGGTMSGAIAMGTNKITGLGTPTANADAATKVYVDTSISNLVASAPGLLDTLDELAAALGDDPNFATTVTNSIATKLPLAGGTMSGAIAMGTNKITGLGDPTLAQDAATKTYVDTADALKLNLSGGTMSGAIAMGTNKITGLGNPTANQDAATKTYVDTADALKLSLTGGTMSGAIAMGTSKITGLGDPTANQDAATKIYVDGILGSATSAAASAAAAATSASNAATSASNASTSASNAATSASSASTSATNAAASYDAFDDRYLGSKTSAPTLDNDGNALLTGALYWNSTSSELYLWTGSAWTRSALSGTDYVSKSGDTMTGALTTTALTLSGGTANGVAYLNGSKVLTSGSALTFDGTTFTTTGSGGIYLGTNNTYLSGKQTSGTLRALLGIDASDYTYNGAYSGYYWTIQGGEQMRLTSTGLGIGTSSPAVKLDVSGANVLARLTSSTANTWLRFANSTDASGYVGYEGANLTFYTADTERMRINSSGNLGLGVTPSAWFSTYKALQIKNNGALTTNNDFFAFSNGAYVDASGNDVFLTNSWANKYRQVGSSGQHQWFTSTASGTAGTAITFTQAMTLDASGNLGVGTTSPADQISTTYSIRVGNQASTGTSGSLRFVSTGGVNYLQSGLTTASNSAAPLVFGSMNNATEWARIDSSGNFGIGTSSPAYKLDVRGDIAGGLNGKVGVRRSDGGLVSYLANVGDSETQLMSNGGGSYITFYTEGTKKATLDSSGNLGLGVTPSAWSTGKVLEISSLGNAVWSPTGNINDIRLMANIYYNGAYKYAANGRGNMFTVGSTVGNFEWYTAGNNTSGAGAAVTLTQAMTLDASGKLGVGVTSPTSVLDVRYDAEAIFRLQRLTTTTGALFQQFNNGGGNYYIGPDSSAGNRGFSGGGGAPYGLVISAESAYPICFGTNNLERARITSTGGFSVGTTANPGAGAIYATGAITAYYSDARLKTVSGKIENALDKVAKLSGVYYTNNDTAKSFGYTSDEVQVGVLAQEIEAVLPQVVKAAPFDLDEDGNSKSGQNYKTVQYDRLVPLLIEAINELQAKVKLLENK